MHPEGTIIRSVPLFTLTAPLIAQLEAAQRERGPSLDPVEAEHDAFLLFGGLGTPAYLSRDGRILWQVSLWEVFGRRADAFAAIAIGAWSGAPLLRTLLPARPASGDPCDPCGGAGRSEGILCRGCHGLGWTDPGLSLDVSVLALR